MNKNNFTDNIKFKKYLSNINKIIANIQVNKELFNEINNNYLFSLILLVFNKSLKKKIHNKLHDYTLILNINILFNLININNNFNYFTSKYTTKHIINYIIDIVQTIYNNINKSINVNVIDDKNKLKIYDKLCVQLNSYLTNYFKISDLNCALTSKKHELMNYNFINPESLLIFKKIKCIDINDIDCLIKDKYANVIIFAFDLLKYINNKDIKTNELCYHLSYILKIYNDVNNIEKDLSLNKTESYNIIHCLGIKATYSLFVEHKTKFIEQCLEQKLYSSYLNIIIDYISTEFDYCINTYFKNIDLETSYSLNSINN